MSELPEWPVCEAENCDDYEAFYDYSHKRYQAAMARLRVAVEKLTLIRESHVCTGRALADVADEALKAIGELPNE